MECNTVNIDLFLALLQSRIVSFFILIDMFDNMRKDWNDGKKKAIIQEANNNFNIIKADDGINYIYYNSVRISTAEDAKGDLLARLNELRNTYINERLKR